MLSDRIHRKHDGYLLIQTDGRCRYLTFVEAILWRVFRRMPRGQHD